MKIDDKEIDAALAKLWIDDGGGPNDGYKIYDMRRITSAVIDRLRKVEFELWRPKIDVETLNKAMIDLAEYPYDPEHRGFCWVDIFDSIEDLIYAVETRDTKKRA